MNKVDPIIRRRLYLHTTIVAGFGCLGLLLFVWLPSWSPGRGVTLAPLHAAAIVTFAGGVVMTMAQGLRCAASLVVVRTPPREFPTQAIVDLVAFSQYMVFGLILEFMNQWL